MENTNKSVSTAVGSPLVAAVKRYMAMLENGQAPSPDEFCLQYPEIVAELLPCLASLVLVENGFGQPRTADLTAMGSPSPAFDPQIPTALGDFRIVRELGRGGMGIVYEAQQLSLGRRVALKVLSFASGLDPVRLQRFRNEAQSAAQLHHTHIVPVYAVGSDRGVHYFAMQLIDGHSLAQFLDTLRLARASTNTQPNALAPDGFSTKDTFELDTTKPSTSRTSRERYFRNVAKMMVQAASGLAHAHLYGVIHRDIKPANLLLDPVGNIWITDFGLAQIQTDSNLTLSGDLLGTLRYMSPEQASSGKTAMDHRTDIYSLGVTLYELLTLQPAIAGTGYQEIASQIADQEPISPRSIDPSIPLELEIIMCKAIAKNSMDRYQTATLMAEDLQRWLDDKPILARSPTAIQRFAKWRRRHSSLVAAGMVFAVASAIGLFVTTLVILREQSKTQLALENESRQRAAAEVSFQQARRAVDTFSELGETELSNRPDLKTLRREFLEASLEFYQGFVELRGEDPSLQNELSMSKKRIERMVDAVTRLDRLEPLRLIAYPSVQMEIGISPEDLVAFQLFLDRDELHDGDMPLKSMSNDRDVALLTQDEGLARRLNEKQWKRLWELHRRIRLPFTFKSIEVTQALGLTQAQKKEIGLIIEQERPDRKLTGGKDGFGNERDKRGPPPPRDRGPRRGRPFDQTLFTRETPITVERILAILNAKQQAEWRDLIGEPFGFEGF